jgi:hypothetical protein
MGRVLTNNTTLSYAIEATLGVLPGSPEWRLLEPNSVGTYGATITTVARNPISQNRQRRKGTVTDLDSAVDWEGDLTLNHLVDFAEGFIFSTAVNDDLTFEGADATGTDYTVPALTASQAARLIYDNAAGPISLVYAQGYATAGNNGLKPLGADPLITNTAITVAGNVIETAPTNATVSIAGIRPEVGDLSLTVAGSVGTLTSGNNGAVNSIDFTLLGLTVGQYIHVGGLLGANQFSAGAGYARITSISAGTLLLDQMDTTLLTDTGAAETVDLLFGRFIRNVATSSSEFLERSFQFELSYPGLDVGNADMFEYAKGNYCNTMAINVPLADKATVSFAFIGTDTDVPVAAGSRATNAATPIEPSRTGAFNTTSDCVRLFISQVDESARYTDFKSLTINLNNNVSPEKILCNLGAQFMNFGNFEVDIEAQLIFSDVAVASAVRDNTTMSLAFGLKNDDGALMFDIPAITIGGGAREFPVNETVLINTTSQAFQHATLGTSLGLSLFPIVP